MTKDERIFSKAAEYKFALADWMISSRRSHPELVLQLLLDLLPVIPSTNFPTYDQQPRTMEQASFISSMLQGGGSGGWQTWSG